MIENLLTEALRKKIEEAVKDFRLPVENGEMRAPEVIDAYLPPKRSTKKDDFPFVIVRAEEGSDGRESADITVGIIIGCYSESDDGNKYCLNVKSRTSQALLTMENNILANKYVLQYPVEWTMVPSQPWPQWQLDMITKWSCNTPQAIF